MLSTTVFAVSAADVSTSVSATPDEAQEQTTEGYCDGFYYTVLDDGTVQITEYNGDETDLVIPNYLNGFPVKRIIGLSSYECNIKNIYLPDYLTYISIDAFFHCDNLENIFSSENNKSFFSIDGVLYCGDGFFNPIYLSYYPAKNKNTNLVVIEGTYGIAHAAFRSAIKLKSITLPKSISHLISTNNDDSNAFYGCDSLENISVDSKNAYYTSENGVLYNKNKTELLSYPKAKTNADFIVPECVEKIGSQSFAGNNFLKNLSLSSNCKVLQDSAFGNCSQLENVNFNDSLQEIDSSVFAGCKSLKKVHLPNSVTKLGSVSFLGCESLKAANIPQNAELGYGLFSSCINLTDVTISEGIKELPECFTDCTSLKSVVLPNSLETLSRTFYNCKSLSEINLPENLQTIEAFSFYNCNSLTKIIIPKSVITIGEYAFADCYNLEEFSMSDGVSKIEQSTFQECRSLTEISIPDSVTVIGERAFWFCDNLKTITLGKEVSELGENFVDQYSSNLENIFVNDENEHYVDDNGILFSKESGELLIYPIANKSTVLNVPDGISTLPDIENHTLAEINIPASVTQIGNINEKLLKNINVSPDNPHFYSINGILFSKDTNEMLCYPPKNETTELTIPDGVDKMCAINSDYLKTLNIPSSVSEIGNISCNALENINVSADNQTYCSIDGVLYNKSIAEMLCFPLASKITDYHIPNSVAELKGYFENAKHLKNIYVPQSVTEFGHYTFTIHGDCIENIYVENGNLNYYSENGILYYKSNGFVAAYPENNKTTDFHIPEGVTYAYSWYFLRDCHYVENVYVPQTAKFNYSTMQYCDNLKNVFVDENNSLYCDIDGVMYSKDKTKLLLYPRGRNPSSISFPATVREIDGCAFYKCNDLTTVVLPERMVRVYGSAFFQCENLRDITFPKGIKQIYGIGYQIGGGPGAGGWIIGDIDNVVIRGYTNSPAETYAKENGFTFISLGTINKLGDSNSDNKVDITDATNIQRYLAEYEIDFSENEDIASDTNGDGYITISDVTEIQRFLAELPSAMSKS